MKKFIFLWLILLLNVSVSAADFTICVGNSVKNLIADDPIPTPSTTLYTWTSDPTGPIITHPGGDESKADVKFDDPGNFTIKVVAVAQSDATNTATKFFSVTVVKVNSVTAKVFNKDLAHVKIKKKVKFTSIVTSIPTGNTANFIFKWKFGDGNTSNKKNPTHKYKIGGVMIVTLTVKCDKNDSGVSDTCEVHVIKDIVINKPDEVFMGAIFKMAFNNANFVKGRAKPLSLPDDCHNLIDWDLNKIPFADANLKNKKEGNLKWDANWPSSNGKWGPGDALLATINKSRFGANDLDSTGELQASIKIAKFYDALSKEFNPSNDPNWFFYYKDNEGGTDYVYDGTLIRSQASKGVPNSIKIADEAYAGDTFIKTEERDVVRSGKKVKQLFVTGVSMTNTFYANFIGIVAHERSHTDNEITTGPPLDSDSDGLPNTFEKSTSHTNPLEKFSTEAGTFLTINFPDNEVYAGGPVEQKAFETANTKNDWAHPGTNWP